MASNVHDEKTTKSQIVSSANKKLLSLLLKVTMVLIVFRSVGRRFYQRGPATEKAHRPDVSLAQGTTRSP